MYRQLNERKLEIYRKQLSTKWEYICTFERRKKIYMFSDYVIGVSYRSNIFIVVVAVVSVFILFVWFILTFRYKNNKYGCCCCTLNLYSFASFDLDFHIFQSIHFVAIYYLLLDLRYFLSLTRYVRILMRSRFLSSWISFKIKCKRCCSRVGLFGSRSCG